MANRSRSDKPNAESATRLIFGHQNPVETLVVFAPLVLILNAIDYSSKWTVLACAVHFSTRVVEQTHNNILSCRVSFPAENLGRFNSPYNWVRF